MITIRGTAEGRPGVWLVTAETAIAMVAEVNRGKIHNILGEGLVLGCDWSKAEVMEHLGKPNLRIAMIFAPNPTAGHQLVTCSETKRWAFDIGEVNENRMCYE